MSKLPIINSKKLIKILKELGFQLDHTTGSHFIFYHQISKKRAVVPYHSKDLPRGTMTSFLREAGITKKEIEKILKR